MICPVCKSNDIKVDVVQTASKTNHVSIIRSMGRMFLILCTCGLWLFVPKRKEHTKYKTQKICVCQKCGHSWKI